MSFFSPKKESECVLVFDIGSGSVGGAIALISREGPPTILYSTRSEMLFRQETDGKRLLALCIRALSEVMLALAHEGFAKSGLSARRPRISEALVSLSAPWTVSRTSFLHLRNPKPMRITKSVFEALLDEAEKTRSDSELLKGSTEIEKKLVKSVLNGYQTSEPYGREASEAEFTLCSSWSLPKITESISDIITHLIHPAALSFHSFSFLSFAVLRDIYPQNGSFVLMDVSGEQTEVSIVKKGVPLETISFPLGKNHLIRALSSSAGMPPAAAESFIKLRAGGTGEGDLYEKAGAAADTFWDEWLQRFLRAMEAFSGELFLPRALYLAADEPLLPLVSRAIAKGDFTKFTLASAPLKTVFIDEAALLPYVHRQVSHSVDPFLALETVFASRLRAGA